VDFFGNVETGDTTSLLSIAPSSGSFAAGSTPTATVSAGVATFTTLKLNTAATYTLQATDTTTPAVSLANSSSFVVNPGAVNTLFVTLQPTTATAGVNFSTMTVTEKDSFGNIVTTDNTTIITA